MLKTEHYSFLRNPLIAKIFYLAGFVERYGSGIGRIVDALAESLTSPTRGHEQSGLRPAVVLAVAYGGMTIVIPLTTTPAAFGFPHTYGIEKSSQNGLSSDSAALVFQIVVLSEDRFVRKIGRCSVEDMETISIPLKDRLSLE